MAEKRLLLAHAEWLEEQERLVDFLTTTVKPPLHFKPTSLCASTEAALAACRAARSADAVQAEARLAAAIAASQEQAAAREAELADRTAPRAAGKPAEAARTADAEPSEPEAADDEDLRNAAEVKVAGLADVLD